MFDKIKSYQYQIFLAVCIGLISFISFNLGKISSNEKGSLKVTQDANIYKAASSEETGNTLSPTSPSINSGSSTKITPKPLDLRVVVSKASDSKKYHYSWCGSWKRITANNQLWFENEADAISAGYTLAGNCTK